MLDIQDLRVSQMYVEERLRKAAHEMILREAEQGNRARRRRVALKVRLGRALVRVGQRLEAATDGRGGVEMGVR